MNFFKTVGIPLLLGRDFTSSDTLGTPKVVIVNEAFASKYFAGANAVGRTFRMEAEAGKPEPLFQIVGLVKNTKYYQLREDFMPVAFFPIAQVDALEEKLKAAGVSYTFHRYRAQHAFGNETLENPPIPAKYDASAAETAWQRTLGFLDQHLSAPQQA